MKTRNIVLVLLLLFSSATLLTAQTIEGIQKGSKYVSLKRVPVIQKAVLPVINWKYPATSFFSTRSKTHQLEACITSSEEPTIVLYVDKVRQHPRNFNIVPVQNGCDYRWKMRVTFSSMGKYMLELEVSNSGGKASESCIVEVKNATTPIPKPKPKPNTDRRLALVIGNATYSKKPLQNPTNDADSMATKLRQLGFQVYKYTNLDKRATNDAVSNFTKRLKKGDVAAFFYAGHGYQIDGVSYLLPIGAIAKIKTEIDAEYEGYRIDRVLGNMRLAGASTNLVFLDAYRDNPVRSVFRSAKGRGLEFPKKTPTGFIISFATAAGETASDGTGRNGTYTTALLKFMDKGNSITDVLTMVNRAVKRKTNQLQTPEYKSSLDNIFRF